MSGVTTMPSTEKSNKVRLEGNELYKSKDFLGAIKKYQEAAKLAPDDVSPLGNISAAYFEVGKYTQCITRAERALELLRGSPEDQSAQVQKFEQRIAKAQANSSTVSNEEELHARLKVLKGLVRYRPLREWLLVSAAGLRLPTRFSAAEYFTVGHDEAVSLFDRELVKSSAKEDSVSFLFEGIGDARHLYRTIIGITEHEQKAASEKKYHITINDINKCALARDLVVMMILDDLSHIDDADSIEAAELPTTVYFVFIGTMMPQFAFNLLHKTIDRALEAIKDGKQPLSWLYLHEADMTLYAEALAIWKGPALKVFKNLQVIQRVNSQIAEAYMPGTDELLNDYPDAGGNLPSINTSGGCAVLIPPTKVLEKHDQAFLNLLQAHPTHPKASAPHFQKHLNANWRFNTTLMDFDWYSNLKQTGDTADFELGHDPFACVEQLSHETLASRTTTASKLYECLGPFFVEVAKAIKLLRGKLVIELIYGDYVDIAEQIHFGIYRDFDGISHRVPRNNRPKEFPISYDRVHLSNVPDYMGGHLSTFLYAVPILKVKPQGIVQSTCLRNTGRWDSLEAFTADYQAIPNTRMLEQLTQVQVLTRGGFLWPMAEYTKYGLAGQSFFRSFPTLLPREPFKKWFYTLFFRIALPFNQNLDFVQGVVNSSLNLTILFRLVSHLRVIGYPSHWLSELLFNILENKVTSSCRPPRKDITSPAALQIDHPEKKLCTAPFAPEMGTLARIFQPLLPFQLTSTALPAETDIYNYTFTISNCPTFDPGPTDYLLLVFWDTKFIPRPRETLMTNLRALLDPSWGDEVDSSFKGSNFERIREKGVVVWSTFTWDVDERKASAWMDKGVVDGFCERRWACGVFRTDIWRALFMQPLGVKDAVTKGERWVDFNVIESLPIRVVN